MTIPNKVKLITNPDEYREVLRPTIERLFELLHSLPIYRGDLTSKSFNPCEIFGQIFKHFVISCEEKDIVGFHNGNGWMLLTNLMNDVHPSLSTRPANSLNHLNAWRREEVETIFKVVQVNDLPGSISEESAINCLLSVDIYEIFQRYHRKKIFRELTWELERRVGPDSSDRIVDKFRPVCSYGLKGIADDFHTEDYWSMVTDIHYLFELYGMYVDEIELNLGKITVQPYAK